MSATNERRSATKCSRSLQGEGGEVAKGDRGVRVVEVPLPMNRSRSSIEVVRPKVVFEKMPYPMDVTVAMPVGGQQWGIKLLETFLLIAIAHIVKAERILEIGTWKGWTATRLARNTSCEVVTVDIDPNAGQDIPPGLRIRQLQPGELDIDRADVVFIDGDHSYEAVKRDTDLAFRLQPKAVVWHDYRLEPGVGKYLAELSMVEKLYHVDETDSVYWFSEPL